MLIDIISCWRLSNTTARIVVVSKFTESENANISNKCPSIISSAINASIISSNLISSISDFECVVDDDLSNFIDEDGAMVISSSAYIEYKYELILSIDNTIEIGSVVFGLSDGTSTVKKSVRIQGICVDDGDIYLYNSNACEALEFVESDDMVGFQKGGRVYCKELIETDDGMLISSTMRFTEIIERTGELNIKVIATNDGFALTSSDGSVIYTL